MKITKQKLRGLIREQMMTLYRRQGQLQDLGLEAGMRVVLTKDINWITRGDIVTFLASSTLAAGTEIEVGRLDDSGYRIEVYDLGQDRLFTVRTSDLIKATE